MSGFTRVKGRLSPGACLASGEYRIEQPLGQGGFGITYRGIDTRLNRAVAVKEFFPEGCWREGSTVVSAGRWNPNTYSNAKQQFLLEGQTLGQFNHPGIVQVFYYFEENNTAYMVMEYLRGKTLAELLKRRVRIPETKAIEYITEVGKALKILHQAQCLHRDIKPDNIMLADDGRLVLIDFGAARDFTTSSTDRYTTMLTPGYSPLEQYGSSLRYGRFTDVYALGSTLYHLLTGEAPISAIERAAGVELQTVCDLVPDVNLHVSQAIAKAMTMDISQRIQSVEEFFSLLLPDSSISPKTNISSRTQDVWGVFGRSNKPKPAKSSQSTEWF